MKWLILGALLGLLLLFPQLLAAVSTVVVVLLSQPVLVAFALGLLAGVRLRRARRWTP